MRTSVILAMALAFATSGAIRLMRRISCSVTIGLLAKPHVPLWMTRTPKPAAPARPPPPRPPRTPPTAPPAPAPPAAPAAPAAAPTAGAPEPGDVVRGPGHGLAPVGVPAAVGRA